MGLLSPLAGGVVFLLLVVPIGLVRRLARSRPPSWRGGDTTRRPVDPATVRLTGRSGGGR